jgi:hypothetical protein
MDKEQGGQIFFAGYDDIYYYDNAQFRRLIEREDQQDWLYTYREGISKASKEAVALMYLPEGIVLVDINQTIGQQYQLYTQFIPDGWRQAAFKQTSSFASTLLFKWFARLQNGTVLAVSTESPAVVYQFSNPTTGAYYYSDAGTAIRYQMDTGNFVPSGTIARDTIMDRFQLSRYFDSPMQGTLEHQVWRDGSVQRVYTPMDKTSVYLKTSIFSDEAKIGSSWRLKVNTDTTSPERLNTGSDFRILGLYLYGNTLPRERVSDASYGTTTLVGDDVTNTVSGSNEVLLQRASQVFTWDQTFLKTYTSPNESVSVPSYVIEEASSPYVLSSDRSQRPTVVISERTLTTWTAYSSEDNTVFRFRATE